MKHVIVYCFLILCSRQQCFINNFIIKEFVYDENANQIPVPEWWKDNIHSRTPRGATEKFISSINSAISNYKNGNIKKFDMKYRTKKDDTDYVHYEDIGYPTFIRKIKSRYWYTTKDRKRKEIMKPFKKTRAKKTNLSESSLDDIIKDKFDEDNIS